MKFIRIYEPGQGCEIPDVQWFLVVVAEEMDSTGNWIPSHSESFNSLHNLVAALKKYMESGEQVVIRASASFHVLAKKMGLPMLFCEWGVL